jgi:hypothetical protein
MLLAERSQLTIGAGTWEGSGRGGVAWTEGRSRDGKQFCWLLVATPANAAREWSKHSDILVSFTQHYERASSGSRRGHVRDSDGNAGHLGQRHFPE